jgi:serine phosphatase RsbU (regulator of sigma subunit)
VLPVSETQAGIFICDVMGHGVRAALVTAIQRALVEELSDVADDPGEFLTRINQALLSILRRTRTPMFASAFYLFVDARTGEMRFANAGHPKPLHIRRAMGRVEPLAAGARAGSALGVFENARYETLSTHAEPHDLVLLFTDGLYEVEGANGEYFDQSRLVAEVRRLVSIPAEQLFEKLLDAVRHFSVSSGFVDDVCLVSVELERLVAESPAKVGEESGSIG